MNSKQPWLTKPKTIRQLWWLLYISLAITVAAELFIEHKPHFELDSNFAFSAWFGFGCCVLMVIGAKVLGFFIKRKDTYYDE